MKKNIYLLLILVTNCLYGQTTVQDSAKALNEVIVSASRIEESIFKAPVSVTKITALQLQNSPSIELISSLARYKVLMLINQVGLLRALAPVDLIVQKPNAYCN
jgi:outer membrane receptor for ferrienterochelin and colicin